MSNVNFYEPIKPINLKKTHFTFNKNPENINIGTMTGVAKPVAAVEFGAIADRNKPFR
jgi:hypothetical protein